MKRVDPKVIPVADLETSLEDFKSEAAQTDSLAAAPAVVRSVSSTSAPTAPMPRAGAQDPSSVLRDGAISLAEILAAEVRIESYEAVAIVQSLCALVLESRMPIEGTTADLSGLHISANGTITAVSVGPHNPLAAVQYLGDVLLKTLPTKDFMFLRERVVEKARSSPPYYSSVEEMSDTLAYYERPDRAAQIREVYSRWKNRGTSPVPPVPTVPQRPFGPTLAGAVAFCTRHAPTGAVGLIGLLVVLMVVLAGFLVRGRDSNQAPRQIENRPAVTDKDRPLAVDLPAGQTPPSVPVAQPALPRQPETGPTVPKRPRESSKSVAENRPSTPAPIETEGRGAPTGSVSAPLVRDLPPLPKPPPKERVDEVYGAAQSAIYSARNTDVIPPAVLFSQLPGPSPLASPQHDVPALEIVVNETGTVDFVRAVARPRNIAESVVITNGLSAAKAWRFRPALKDGHPVRYRLLIALSTD